MTGMLPILPEILLLSLGILILIIDPFIKNGSVHRPFLGWFTTAGLIAIIIVTILFTRPGEPTLVFGGMIRFDWLGFIFKVFFLFAGVVTALFFMDADQLNDRAEAYLLLIASILGMCLMASAADLVMVYLAIETTSIPLYILAGFLKENDQSVEAGFKYMLFGALTSAILLYGFSLIYGFTGNTNLYQLKEYFTDFNPVSIGITFMVLAGLAFKVSLFPFHFWAPDVYEGAPTAVTGFLSTASKAAGFAVLARLFTAAFPEIHADWSLILAILATLTMTVGNLIALTQKSIKRMLAYSSIAHAGYAMIGIVAYSELGMGSTVFYLIAYVVTNLLAFGIVAIVGKATGSEDTSAYNGLSRRNAGLGLAALVAFLSLSGMPPFAGFVGKVFVFITAVESGWTWLVIVGVLNSIVGLFYYLNVLKAVYLYRLKDEDEEKQPVHVSKAMSAGLVILVMGIILLGTIFGPWFDLASKAVLTLF